MTRTLWLLLSLLALLWPSAARAVEVSDYRIEVDLRDPHRARYTLYIDYDVEDGQSKVGGFKFLGEGEVRGLRLIDSPGASIAESGGYREARVDFDLSVDALRDPEPITFTFTKDTLPTRGWDAEVYDIDWASKFAIPVSNMSSVVLLPSDWDLEPGSSRYTCIQSVDGKRCEYEGPLHRVHFAVQRRNTMWLSALLALVLLTGALLLGRAWAKKRWLTRCGILPVLEEPPAPAPLGSYRAPAPLPTETTLDPILSEEDHGAFRNRFFILAVQAGLGLFLCFALMPGASRLPLWLVFCGYALGIAALCTLLASREKSWTSLPLALTSAVVFFFLYHFDTESGLWSLFLLGPVGLISLIAAIPGSSWTALGSSSSGRSSGTSFFSCGGGGGCGGGGCGGGGCGGCGG